MSKSIIELIDNKETLSVELTMGLDKEFDPSSPSHKLAMFIGNNLAEIAAMASRPAARPAAESKIIIEG